MDCHLYPLREGKSVLSNGVTLDVSTTSRQSSCTGEAGQHIVDSTVFCVCFYLVTVWWFISVFPFGFVFFLDDILFSWIGGVYCCIVFLFVFVKELKVGWVEGGRGCWGDSRGSGGAGGTYWRGS